MGRQFPGRQLPYPLDTSTLASHVTRSTASVDARCLLSTILRRPETLAECQYRDFLYIAGIMCVKNSSSRCSSHGIVISPYLPEPPPLSTVSQFPKTPSQSPKHHQHKSKKKKRVQCYAQENAYVSEIGQRVLAESFYQRSLPLSRSSSASMSLLMTGPAALGSSFVRRAACSWTSSSDSSRNRP